MMSVSVSSFVSYAQSPSEEPAQTDSVPAQEPQGEASLFGLNEEPAPADSVPTQEPQKDEPQANLYLLGLTEEPTDSVPTQEPQKDEPQAQNSIA